MRGIWKIGVSGKDALRRGFIALLAVFAVGLHAFVVETHIDGLPAPAAAIAQTADAGGASAKLTQLPTHKTLCLICQEQARAGTFLNAAPPVLAPVEHAQITSIELATAAAIRVTSHIWQSRAPPTLL